MTGPARNPLRVIHITPSIGRSSFGVGEVVGNLAQAQNEAGLDVEIWTVRDAHDELPEASWSALERRYRSIGPKRLAFSPWLEAAAARNAQAGTVFHLHGIWTALSRAALAVSSRGLPVIIAPHGSLETWALARSKVRKQIATIAYENENFRCAAAFHAVAEGEAADIKALGLKKPIAVIPNGIGRGWLQEPALGGSRVREEWGIPEGHRLILFLSRITPKKNLPGLLGALAGLDGTKREWALVVAGPDEFEHLKLVRNEVARLGLEQRVRFVGPAVGRAKRELFEAADVFVLPSLSEGAPLVVLEALGAGLPVICTKASPWEDLVRHRCGWWVSSDEQSLRTALEAALLATDGELVEMGRRGKSLVSREYLWGEIAGKAERVYRWLVGQAGMPPCVHAGERVARN